MSSHNLIRYPAAERNKVPILDILQRIFLAKKSLKESKMIDSINITNVLEIGI